MAQWRLLAMIAKTFLSRVFGCPVNVVSVARKRMTLESRFCCKFLGLTAILKTLNTKLVMCDTNIGKMVSILEQNTHHGKDYRS